MLHHLKWLVCVVVFCVIVAGGAGYGNDTLELRMIKVRHGNGRSICDSVQTALSPDGKVSFDQATGTIVVVDRSDYLGHIEELVGVLDVSLPQIQISVRITEVDDEFIRKAGIRSAQVIYPPGSFGMVLDLLNTRTGAFTKSEMKLATASGVPASLQVSREALFPVARVEFSDGSGRTYVGRRDVGDFLEVLPVFNPDNTITVQIRPARSSIKAGGVLAESEVLTQVTVHNGDTIAIGGVDEVRERSQRITMLFLSVQTL